jgi:hypothetical protein
MRPSLGQTGRTTGSTSAPTQTPDPRAQSRASSPSFLLMRRASGRRAAEQAIIIMENLDTIADDLHAGAILVLGEHSLRIRKLPLAADDSFGHSASRGNSDPPGSGDRDVGPVGQFENGSGATTEGQRYRGESAATVNSPDAIAEQDQCIGDVVLTGNPHAPSKRVGWA